MSQLGDAASSEQPDPRYNNEDAKDPPAESSWGKLLPWVPRGALVLEVGCAHGSFSFALRSKRGCRVIGVEIDPERAQSARAHCDQVIVGDIARLLQGDLLPKEVDVVIAADVIEHLSEPLVTLRGLRQLLRRGGILLASIPNVTHLSVLVSLVQGSFARSREGLLDSSHLQFYGEADLLALFKDAGYAVRIVDRVKLDPRLTEFRTNLEAVPEPVLEYFDNNPNSTTYQFIVEAVPLEWATEADDTLAPGVNGNFRSFRNRLIEELVEAQEQIKRHHETLLTKDDELRKHQSKVAEYHGVLTSQRTQLEALHGKLAQYHDALLRANKQIQELQQKFRASIDLCMDTLSHTMRSRAQARRRLESDEQDKLRVLFVTNRQDAPYRYRCVHACEQLRDCGAVANALRLDDPTLLEKLPSYSVVILFRLEWSDRVDQLIRSAHHNGLRVGFDIDDLVFHPSVESMIPFLKHLPSSTVNQYRAQFAALLTTLRAADFCIAATPTIAKYLALEQKPTIVHPNLIPRAYLNMAPFVYRARPALLREEMLGYMSGSDTHDGDLDHVAPALQRIFERHRKMRLVVCGHVSLSASLGNFRSRITRIGYQDYRVYPWLMARCRAVIAPLEVINDFTNAKSALKVFEAGVFGVPVVASPVESYREAIQHGATGFLAHSTEEWVAALSALMDRDTSLRLGASARSLVLESYSPDAHPALLARSLLPHCGQAKGKKPTLLALAPDEGSPAALLERVAQSIRLAIAQPQALWVPEEDPPLSMEEQVQEADGIASRWMACARREGRNLIVGDSTVGCIIADRLAPFERWNGDLVPIQGGPNPGSSFRVVGNDPMLIANSCPLLKTARYILVEMTANSALTAVTGQLFFSGVGQEFTERLSHRFEVIADGRPRAYVLALSPELQDFFRSVASPLRARFDPLDAPGEIELKTLAILSKPPRLPSSGYEVRKKLAERFVRGTGIEIGALQNPLPAPPGAKIQYVDHLTLEEARAQFPELADLKLVDPAIIDDAETLQSIVSGSQDFVVACEVLEHMKDPVGALRNWLRVLKPGGFLYLSIPDHTNQFDRSREVTSVEHLLRDHELRGARSAEDERHYHEWTAGAHPEMSPEEQAHFTAKLLAERHRIHFHVFDDALFARLLAHVAPLAAAKMIELLRNRVESSLEHIAVLQKLMRPTAAHSPGVDIVIPIYNGRELTNRCVHSVLAHATGDWRLILVDDASNDPALKEDLAKLVSSDSRVRLLVNENNEGFVRSANRGMRQAGGRDVLLLNSDTEVFAGFLDRLSACAYADDRTGVVSPFSNNATICSIPEFGKDNPIPPGYTAASYAELVAACSRQRRPELVTAVGFCMYIKASLLARVGFFDESYGRGFGEENDFCERAKKAGFTIRLCDDVFIWHKGKASFGNEGTELESKNALLLEAKQPGYHAAVAEFFQTNPLAPLHSEIRFHTSRFRKGGQPAIMYVVHASPFSSSAGGTELYLRDLLRALALPRAVVAYPAGKQLIFAEVIQGDVEQPLTYRVDLIKPAEGFCLENPEVIGHVLHRVQLFGVTGVHIQHLLWWPIGLGNTLSKQGIKTVYSSHDFYCVCPSWNLYDHALGSACACDRSQSGPGCLPVLVEKTGIKAGVDLALLRDRHRGLFAEFLTQVDCCIFPSAAARDVVTCHLSIPAERTRVIEHGCDLRPTTPHRARGDKLRIGVVGEIAYPIKGADNYLELVRQVGSLDVEWHFFGTTNLFEFEQRVKDVAKAPTQFHGRYNRGDIVNLLRQEGIDLCVLLPKVDETFSYVVSEAAIAGVPLLALRRGAPAERIARGGLGMVVSTIEEARQCIERLCRHHSELNAFTERVSGYRHPSVADNAAAVRQIYEELEMMRAADGLPAPEVLAETYLGSDEYTEFRATQAQRAAPAPALIPKYQQSTWYPAFLKLKPFVPKAVRELGRKLLVRLEDRPALTVDPVRTRCVQRVSSLKAVRRAIGYTEYHAEGPDPQIVISAGTLARSGVKKIRFRLRRSFNGAAYAQLFWRYGAEEDFSEANSAKVALDGAVGAWREYSVELAASNQGRRIFELRFDPTNVPGTFEMSPLEVICSADSPPERLS